MSPAELHITSFLVHARPDDAGRVVAAITALEGIEVHGRSAVGKIVVTLESASEHAIVERLNDIRELPGVLAAVLVFHQVETGAPGEAEPCR